jgi:hypothetical protein
MVDYLPGKMVIRCLFQRRDMVMRMGFSDAILTGLFGLLIVKINTSREPCHLKNDMFKCVATGGPMAFLFVQ